MKKKSMRILLTLLLVAVLATAFSVTAFAAGDVAGATESTLECCQRTDSDCC